MTIDPGRLLILRAVRRAGGVQAAAGLLHVTPSGISQHLAKLEAEVGLDLVDRSRRGGGRPLCLTAAAAGHRLADGAERVADALSAAERDLDEFRTDVSGPLRIGGFSVAITELVAPVAMRLAVTDPTLDPCIYELTEAEGLARLGTGDLDMLISERLGPGDPERPAGVVERDLMPDPYRVIVPGVLASAHRRGRTAGQAVGYDVVRHPLPAGARRRLREARRHAQRAQHRHWFGRHPVALVANGLGAAIIPALTLSQNPTPNVRLSRGVIDPGGRIISVLLPANRASAAADRFVAELRRYAASGRAEENPLG
ncbi:LysR family transcriptional regulator [Fodinicola feengrottensis]|uniref:LysR family transcriptional regulator n=1 Tax=Fodinicola feengrottensis TaxID=435914 RepID=UPI0013D502F8|nr:LysR family transcriptional regulator [Fodinicola feengrottensis]